MRSKPTLHCAGVCLEENEKTQRQAQIVPSMAVLTWAYNLTSDEDSYIF